MSDSEARENGVSGDPEDAGAWLGHEILMAREHAGLTQGALAKACGVERTYISRVESGKRFPSERFVEACDREFNTPGVYTRLRHRLNLSGHPGWFRQYVGLERDAESISEYTIAFVVGLLQTPDYAEAVFRAARPRETDSQIKTRVEARMRRHEVLERDNPPLLWLIHEAALRTVVGSAGVMVNQLEHLALAAAGPNVALQILPFEAGAPPAGLPFILLTQSPGGQQILYSETTGQGCVTDSPGVVSLWAATYDRLRMAAESESNSLRLIHSIMKEYAR